jgi:LytS/YehU family sensor histidine kinase
VPKEMYGKGIAPITLQLLLENAIKHNTASEREPLIVKVYTEPGYLVVENNINIKTHEEPSLKMGLKNIEERYRLLSDNVPLVLKNKKIFQVKVPLLKYEN